MITTWKIAGAVLACNLAFSANAAMLWDESSAGDLSNDGLAPTQLNGASGSNTVVGTVGNAGSGIDRDYFSFTVPTGYVLTSLVLLPDSAISGGSGFLAIQAGPQLTVSPSGAGAENLLGFVHYDNSHIGTDVLSFFSSTGALASGTYSIWIQELGGQVPYGLDFTVTPVPLPGAALLLSSGLLGLAGLRRRRQASVA